MCLAINAAIYMTDKIIARREAGNASYTVDFYKLHKLLYLAQGIMLAQYNKRMFKEDITAHSCGVYVSSYCNGEYVGGLDYYYTRYGTDPVQERTENTLGQYLTSDRKEILDYVVDRYGSVDRDDLIFQTKKHRAYTDVYQKTDDRDEKPTITDEMLRKFFIEQKTELYPDYK